MLASFDHVNIAVSKWVARIHDEHQTTELRAMLKKLENVLLPRTGDFLRDLGEAVARQIHEATEVPGFKVVESLRASGRLAGARKLGLASETIEHA